MLIKLLESENEINSNFKYIFIYFSVCLDDLFIMVLRIWVGDHHIVPLISDLLVAYEAQ